MVTRQPGHAARRWRVYLTEWMEDRGLNDAELAERLGVDRVTVTRWRGQPHRLNPDKMVQIAAALGVEPPDLWRPPAPPVPPNPNRPSIDALLHDAPDETVQRAAEMTAILLRRN